MSAGRTPSRNFRAYRRKAPNGDVWLVLDGYFYEIDDALDRVWLAIDGETPVADIARHAFGEHDMSEDEAREQTETVLAQMVELGLIEWAS